MLTLIAVNSPRSDTSFEQVDRITGRMLPLSLAQGVFDTYGPLIPHLGTIIVGGGNSNDRLRWSEVCWATSLMAGRLRERQYQAHGIARLVFIDTRILLALANVALQGIYILHHQNECTCDSSTL
jgi:hypothetical protein